MVGMGVCQVFPWRGLDWVCSLRKCIWVTLRDGDVQVLDLGYTWGRYEGSGKAGYQREHGQKVKDVEVTFRYVCNSYCSYRGRVWR